MWLAAFGLLFPCATAENECQLPETGKLIAEYK